jgi:hypothetical protein
MRPRVNINPPTLLTPLRLFFFLLAAPVLILTLVLFLTIESEPITRNTLHLTHTDIQNVLKAINNSQLKEQKMLRLSEKNLNIALSYLLNHYLHSTSKITIEQQQLDFKIALLFSNNYFRKYLNFNFKLTKQDGYPIINHLKIGKISIADEYAGLILEKIIKHTPLKEYYILAAQHTKDINISADRFLTISYITPSDIDFNNKLSLNNSNLQSILLYQHQITNIIAQHNPKWRLSLAELFQPLFKQAYQRSTPETAILENRAVLIAISTYVNKSEIQTYIPFDISPSTPKQYPASLYKRPDMAKHFMASAVLAASGAETLANMLGQNKELDDAKHGSGFSFIDLASDRAGLKFGKIATSSPAKARELQKTISNIKDYTSFMPDVRDLPENMNDIEFKNKFESVSSVKYQNMLKKIDDRISSLPIYQ